jgi:hypothetical protein
LIYGVGLVIGLARVPARRLIGAAVLIALMLVFAGVFRGKLHEEAGRFGQGADVADLRYAATASVEEVRSSSRPLEDLLLRFDDFRPLAAVHRYYRGSLLEGETFGIILWDPIPRVFWPEKPSHSDLALITSAILREGGSSPLTLPGEFFVNFGDVGGWLSGLMAGLAWILIDLLFDRRRRDPIVLAFCGVSWAGLSLYVATIAALVGVFYKTLLVALFIRWLLLRIFSPAPVSQPMQSGNQPA